MHDVVNIPTIKENLKKKYNKKTYIKDKQRVPTGVRFSHRQAEAIASNQVDISACFADWSTHEDESMYWSWDDFSFLQIENNMSDDSNCHLIESNKAVTEDVPKSFKQALADPKWGDAARKELNTLISTKAIMNVDPVVAKDILKNSIADLVYLFPVYEEKIKEGKLVYKVRLVGDGRSQFYGGETYSATPSREELLILMHIISSSNWSYCHIDEIRAFLNAPYQGEARAFAKFRGDEEYYEILGALYGLKTAPKDYQDFVETRMTKLGFKRLVFCSCIYTLIKEDYVIIVFDYVDDFIFTGNNEGKLREMIDMFRSECDTTEPIWDAETILGMEFKRDREKKIIKITMSDKILDLSKRFDINTENTKQIPMPKTGYIIKEEDFQSLTNKEDNDMLCAKEVKLYMAIVGGLLWICGIRMDILFATMYLTWSAKSPRRHHMKMSHYVLSYLYSTHDLPLVLGGNYDLDMHIYTDASLGTGPKGRSVVSSFARLNKVAGAVSAKTEATKTVFTSSFEAELDGTAKGFKRASRVQNTLTELGIVLKKIPTLYADNKAMIEFVQGKSVAKGVYA